MIEDELIKSAIRARERAYAPYSNFRVGAAILDETGSIHTGQNVENAAYPNGICAETSAIAAMINSGGNNIIKIAVSGESQDFLCTPCGGCRQRIREFSVKQTEVIIVDENEVKARFSISDLLPNSFGPENLM